MDFNIFTLVGEIIVLIAIILIFLISITFILGNYTLNNDKLMFPKLLLLALNLTYQPTKNIMKFFKCDELFVDRVSITLRNRLNINSFKKLNAKDLIVILPHCLRAKNCPAKLGSSGLSCIKCGKCSVGIFEEICERKGIGIYIVPGSTFIKRVIKQRPFKGVICVACPVDLNQALMFLSNYITQGVYLLNDGCINTRVNENEVIYLLNTVKPTTNYTPEIVNA